MEKTQAEKRIAELTKIIEYHNNLYYNQDEPEISDFEYDMLLRELAKLEEEFPALKAADSPTNSVGGSAGQKEQRGQKGDVTFHTVVGYRVAAKSWSASQKASQPSRFFSCRMAA